MKNDGIQHRVRHSWPSARSAVTRARSSWGLWPSSSKGKSMTIFQALPLDANDASLSSEVSRTLPNTRSALRLMPRHRWVVDCRSWSVDTPSSSASRSRTSLRRLPRLSTLETELRIARVSTSLSTRLTVGLWGSPPTCSSPARAAQLLSLVTTTPTSMPGTGLEMRPWFNATSLRAVRFWNGAECGTSAASSRVLTSRSSVTNAAVAPSVAMASSVRPWSPTSMGRNVVL